MQNGLVPCCIIAVSICVGGQAALTEKTLSSKAMLMGDAVPVQWASADVNAKQTQFSIAFGSDARPHFGYISPGKPNSGIVIFVTCEGESLSLDPGSIKPSPGDCQHRRPEGGGILASDQPVNGGLVLFSTERRADGNYTIKVIDSAPAAVGAGKAYVAKDGFLAKLHIPNGTAANMTAWTTNAHSFTEATRAAEVVPLN
jgi:hypothetical protein